MKEKREFDLGVGAEKLISQCVQAPNLEVFDDENLELGKIKHTAST